MFASPVRTRTHGFTTKTQRTPRRIQRMGILLGALCVFVVHLFSATRFASAADSPYFGIHVVDEVTNRGVPLIELRTVNDIAFYTDNAGWIAFHEPGLMNREVYFAVSGPGYERAKDGFGFRGVRLTPKPGETVIVKVQRTNIAERIGRLTGQGIYRDSTLLGLPRPLKEPNLVAGVLGQDSVQVMPYRGKLFWLWGDTNLPNYPLGNFQTTSATSPLPKLGTFDADAGIAFTYFTDGKQPDRVRKMMPLKEPGPVWLFGLLTVSDNQNRETLLAHFTRRKSLAEEAEHGLARFDDEAGQFVKLRTRELAEKWRFPRGNAVRVQESDGDYFYFADPFCNTRVKATWADLLDPTRYESLAFDATSGKYQWQRTLAPTTQPEERKLIASGKLPANQARYAIVDASSQQPVTMHGASVNWNAFRKKWVMIGVQAGEHGAPSYLGEVWYAEADHVAGPWRRAVKIASHPKYSFYNPRQHPFFDTENGRILVFEGTYTHTFSGNMNPTPRYDYNQLMYRLDLSDPRLAGGR